MLHSRWRDTPLPTDITHSEVLFQKWKEFDNSAGRWNHLDHPERAAGIRSTGLSQEVSVPGSHIGLVLVTWNIDSASAEPATRISAIMSYIHSLSPAVDIIFLQEVSRTALSFLLGDSNIRNRWLLSDTDTSGWGGGHLFGTVTLLSRTTFRYPDEGPPKATLGPIWRVKYPSRFGRDALCCDIFIAPPADTLSGAQRESHAARLRLINVHLDSLALNPSRRPQQITIAASFLDTAGQGLVAGDFNPVLPEDASLVEKNGLVDAWTETHPGEPGFTWGIDGMQAFPPGRLDKVATVGLEVSAIEAMHPGLITLPGAATREAGENEPLPWSDHSGLRCSFQLASMRELGRELSI